jgi:phosphoenolpyruvate carboxykinase (GTP)
MTLITKEAITKIADTKNFAKALHSIGDLNPDRRFIMHFPQENLVMSFGSGYGGNALLGKKCFSLRMASCLGRQEGWLAEHMIIIGVETPNKEVKYFLGAFPSACGKTNLALLDPVLKGYKIWTIGDDIAWINIGPDGRLYAINPEQGFFGVAPGTSDKTNPIMIQTLKNDKFFPTLFTNTALNTYDNTPWWEGLSDETPKNLIDWQGQKYDISANKPAFAKSSADKPAAHPNSRFTVSVHNCPTLSKEYFNPNGVPISGIIFGGRRKDTMPLVLESFDWSHGVFLASAMGSETTAAAAHQTGIVRRDPMAMLPFCGYNMADYFNHWLNFGANHSTPVKFPKIFMVNWFRKDENENFMWPGFRENSRIIKWMIDRIDDKVSAQQTHAGLVANEKDIDLSGLNISSAIMKKLLSINHVEWKKEITEIESFYATFGARIPQKLAQFIAKLKTDFNM